MSDHFDPYHKWLAIPPRDQPPNHYRLLGVPLFEDDVDVIASAADRQMVHVKSYAAGPHADLSQRVLNELATAKLCLLSAANKTTYDAQLRAQLQAAEPPQGHAAVHPVAQGAAAVPPNDTPPVVDTLSGVLEEAAFSDQELAGSGIAPATAAPSRRKVSWKKRRHQRQYRIKVAAGLVGAIVGLFVIIEIGSFAVPKVAAWARSMMPSGPSSDAGQGDDGGTSGEPAANDATQGPGATTTGTQPTVPAADPFAHLNAQVDLPSVQNIGDVTLTRIGLADNGQCQLELLRPAFPPAEGLRFHLHHDPVDSNPLHWSIYLVDDKGQEEPSPGFLDSQPVIAELAMVDKLLHFHWTRDAVVMPAGQLRNCLLRVVIDDQEAFIRLRAIEPLLDATVNLDYGPLATNSVLDLPPSDHLYLEITHLQGLAEAFTVQPPNKVVRVGDPIVVQFDATPRAALNFHAARQDGALVVTSSVTYRHAADASSDEVFELTMAGLRERQTRYAGELTSAQRESKDGQNRVGQLRRDIEAERRRPVTGGARAKQEKQQRIRDLRAEMEETEKRVDELTAEIPHIQSRLDDMLPVERLLHAIHGQVQVTLRVFYRVGEREIDLLVAGSGAPLPGAEGPDAAGPDAAGPGGENPGVANPVERPATQPAAAEPAAAEPAAAADKG